MSQSLLVYTLRALLLEFGLKSQNPDLNPEIHDFATLFTFNDSNPLQNLKHGKILVKWHHNCTKSWNSCKIAGFYMILKVSGHSFNMGHFLPQFVNWPSLYPWSGSINTKSPIFLILLHDIDHSPYIQFHLLFIQIDEDEHVDMVKDNPYNWRFFHDLLWLGFDLSILLGI